MMQRILIIAPPGSYRLAPFLKACNELGFIPVIASTSEHAILPAGVEGFQINLDDLQQALTDILEAAASRPFSGILGTDDITIELASHAASALNLPHNPVAATRCSHRKDIARDTLSQHDINTPWHQTIAVDAIATELDLPYPVVIKPLDLSASRGVIRANNPDELVAAIKTIQPIILDSHDPVAREHVLIEQYIDGVEIAVEALLDREQLHTLAVFDKPEPLVGPYFEETYYTTPSRLPTDVLQACEQQVLAACKAYGLVTGPIHAELRIDQNKKPWILEVASRTIGGDCSQTIKLPGDLSLEQLVIQYATGHAVKPEQSDISSGVLMIPVPARGLLKRVEGLTEARAVEYISAVNIDIQPGNEVQMLPEASSYLGFIFAEAETPDQVEQALRQAHACLNFVITPIWSIKPD